jgi:translation initiation factor eIF-2B subunit beta
VISSFFKLTPKFCFRQDTYNRFVNPSLVYKPEETAQNENIEVVVPAFDFLPPEYITLHITQFGEQTNFYIYRLFNELYTKEERNAKY